MHKVVYNACYGGFSLSPKAVKYLRDHGVSEEYCETYSEIPRHHPILVQCITELGNLANGRHANLQLYDVYGMHYYISENDGYESVKTPDNINWISIE